MSLTPYTGTFGRAELLHLLRRTLFGVKKTDLSYFSGKALSDVVLELVTAPALPNPPVNDYQSVSADANIPYGTTWAYGPQDGNLEYRRQESFRGWWTGQMIHQSRTVVERMVVFLQNLVPTEISNINRAIYTFQYNNLLRQHALGNYKTFIRLITVNPAMLIYLNGRFNQKTSPDENYGRELQELFTIGKDLPSYYTEDDVKAAAKVLTGWRESTSTLAAYYTESRHDTTNKQFSSFYNNTVIQGRTGVQGGQQEIDDMLNMIFAHDEVARYICRKIYRYFVYYKIDANVEQNVIVPLANIFRASNYELQPVLQSLFNSEHFFEAQFRGAMIKSPIDFVMGFARQCEVVLPSLTDHVNIYKAWRYYYNEAGKQQQYPAEPPSVAGWPAYYQAPVYHQSWISAEVLRKRKEFLDTLILRSSNGTQMDVIAFTQTLDSPSDPNALIDEVLELFHPLIPDTAVKDALKAILLSNQVGDYYWTTAWTNYLGAPTNTTYLNTVRTRLRTFFQTVTNMSEYHLH